MMMIIKKISSFDFREIFKNHYFAEHLQATASRYILLTKITKF